MCREAARLGALGIDLVGPEALPVLKKYGLVAATVSGGSGMKSGINDKKNHAEIDAKMRTAINAAADAGAPKGISTPPAIPGATSSTRPRSCAIRPSARPSQTWASRATSPTNTPRPRRPWRR
jgi:hydroxypyruvate isomerase